MIIED
jgi:hypothetical protein